MARRPSIQFPEDGGREAAEAITDEMMSLQALIEEAPGGDLLRDLIGFAAQRLPEAAAGAASFGDRVIRLLADDGHDRHLEEPGQPAVRGDSPVLLHGPEERLWQGTGPSRPADRGRGEWPYLWLDATGACPRAGIAGPRVPRVKIHQNSHVVSAILASSVLCPIRADRRRPPTSARAALPISCIELPPSTARAMRQHRSIDSGVGIPDSPTASTKRAELPAPDLCNRKMP